MKIKFNLIIILIISFFSDMTAQNANYSVRDLISVLRNSNTPIGVNVGPEENKILDIPNLSVGTRDCFLLSANFQQNFLKAVPSNGTTVFFGEVKISETANVLGDSLDIVLKFGIRQDGASKYKFTIERSDVRMLFSTSQRVNYFCEDICVEGTADMSVNILVSGYNMLLFTNGQIVRPLKELRYYASPLFFGLNSDSNTSSDQNNIQTFLNFGKSNGKTVRLQNLFKTGAKISSNIFISFPTEKLMSYANELLKFRNNGDDVANYRMANQGDNKTLIDDELPPLSNLVKLYPNPSNGSFNVDFAMKEAGSVNFEIIDIKGQIVFEQKEQQFAQGPSSHILDTNNTISAGIYTLRVTSTNFSETKKIIIK